MERKKKQESLKNQVRRQASKPPEQEKDLEGDTQYITSTGSTLLDLSITGGRVKGGGLPSRVFVEIFGPHSSGKTVLLCSIASYIQGQIMFRDPEGRLDRQFARLFGLDVDHVDYSKPQRVPEVFEPIRDWQPNSFNVVNGIFIDSLAALSTDLEMDNKEGDKMGMRRAKEFSEELRKTHAEIVKKNYLVVSSNQVRDYTNPISGQVSFKSPGGRALEHWASVRLKITNPKKIKRKKIIKGKEETRVVGIEVTVEVNKNSTWEPYRKVPIYIYYKYGIDDIRANLQYIKKTNTYTLDGQELHKEMNEAIMIVEQEELKNKLRQEVIELWEEIEQKLFSFESKRKPKRR